jgi:hypothetical protein
MRFPDDRSASHNPRTFLDFTVTLAGKITSVRELNLIKLKRLNIIAFLLPTPPLRPVCRRLFAKTCNFALNGQDILSFTKWPSRSRHQNLL